MKRFLAYAFRWQLSTPILWFIVWLLGVGFWPTVIANLVGAYIFFWVDKYIFTSRELNPQWEIANDVLCADCHHWGKGYRIVKMKGHDWSNCEPKWRCEKCSDKKARELGAI